MNQRLKQIVMVLGVGLALMYGRQALAAPVSEAARQAPTSTPPPIRVEVTEAFVNVRSGPNTDYDLVGRMNRGQSGEILGKVLNGQFLWLKVVYIGGPDNTGWVFANNVVVIGDLEAVPDLPIPPTPTRPPTNTPGVDTLFGTATPDPNAGRLPTFTPPPPIVRPTLLPAIGAEARGGFPPALAIISLFVLGGFGLLVSLIRQRP
jgi:hypothetical protein